MPALFMSGWKSPLPSTVAGRCRRPAAEQAAELAVEVAPQLVEVRRALVAGPWSAGVAAAPGFVVGRSSVGRHGLIAAAPTPSFRLNMPVKPVCHGWR